METHFLSSANKVLNMYDRRQNCVKFIPADSASEIYWGSEILLTLAGVASYTGCTSAIVISAAAQEWRRSGVRPSDFILPVGDESL